MSKRYFTGKPCKRGHIAERHVTGGACVECKREAMREWRAKNPERWKALRAKYEAASAERIAEQKAEWRKKNAAKHYAANLRWIQKHRGKARAQRALRKAHVKLHTPAWADKEAIKFFYECRPAGCHVDHIIPLRGEAVCGLHVAENLQWLPASENCRKRNRFKPYVVSYA